MIFWEVAGKIPRPPVVELSSYVECLVELKGGELQDLATSKIGALFEFFMVELVFWPTYIFFPNIEGGGLELAIAKLPGH